MTEITYFRLCMGQGPWFWDEDFRLDKVSQNIQKQLQLDLASREHWYVSGTINT